jgi:hypothetical protein
LPPRKNTLVTLAALVAGFFVTAGRSFSGLSRALMGKPVQPLRENSFLDALNFTLHTGPRGFWRKPSGLRAGRALSTFVHYVFFKDASFRRK